MTVTTFMAIGLMAAAALAQQQPGLSAQSSQPRISSSRHVWASDRLSRQYISVVTFDEADQNNDGKLTRREARGVPNLSFSSADSDNDSSLSREEFTLATANPRG
jgi:hypothetical protein